MYEFFEFTTDDSDIECIYRSRVEISNTYGWPVEEGSTIDERINVFSDANGVFTHFTIDISEPVNEIRFMTSVITYGEVKAA